MSTHDRELSAREHIEMRDLVLAGTQRIRPAGAHRTQFVAIGLSLVLVGAVAGGILSASLFGGREPAPIAPPGPTPTETVPGGWVAYSSGFFEGDIYFVKPGSAPHRVLGSDDDDIDQVCPAFAPDGTRLASGQAAGSQQSGWQDPALVVTDLTSEGEPTSSMVIPLEGMSQPPCPIWSPDGRWIAFGAQSKSAGTWGVAGEAWMFDTQTGEIRRVTELTATDIEWAADSSQLYIADAAGILRYSLATATTDLIPDSAGAVALTASPNGESLAVEQRRAESTELAERYDLWLTDADGGHREVLVADYTHERGIGPIWSPDGSRIVFQRSNDALATRGGEVRILGENDQVVIVTVRDNDPLGPVGTQTVVAGNTTEGSDVRRWFPVTVSWGPDSSTLRFVGWELLASGDMAPGSGLLTVPVDSSGSAAILWETPEGIGQQSIYPLNDFQSWSR